MHTAHSWGTIKSRAQQFLRTSLTPRGIPMAFLSFSFFPLLFFFSFGYFETASHYSLSFPLVSLKLRLTLESLLSTELISRLSGSGWLLAPAFLLHSLEPTYPVKIKVGIWFLLFPVLEMQPLTFHTRGATHPASEPHPEPRRSMFCGLCSKKQGTETERNGRGSSLPPF